MLYQVPTRVPTPYIGAKTLASDPQSETKYRIYFDSTVQSVASGTVQHSSKVFLQTPLHQVKYLRLLYATIPNVQTGGGSGMTDEAYIIRVKGSSKESLPGGPFVNTEIDRNHPLQPLSNSAPVQSAQFVLQNTAFDTTTLTFPNNWRLFYQAEANYDLTIYYPIGITKLSELEFQIFNSKGEEVVWPATAKVLMCFEVVCSGQG